MDSSPETGRDAAEILRREGDPDAAAKLLKQARSTRNGKARLLTLDALDSRCAAAVAARQLIADLSADLGSDLTAAERQLAQRAALVGAILDDFETRWVAGEQICLSDYFVGQRRALTALGLERRARPINGAAIRPRDVSPLRSDLVEAR